MAVISEDAWLELFMVMASRRRASIIWFCRKSYGPHATDPTSDQTGLMPTENTISLNVKLDMMVPLIKLPIGLVDVGFLAKRNLRIEYYFIP